MARRLAPIDKSKKSASRREAILQTALLLFDRQGFANTSLDDIAREMNVKREGIYYYYRNKNEILLSIIRPQSEALVAGLKAIVRSEADPAEKLKGAIRNHLERFDRHCLEMTVSMRDAYLEDLGDVRREMKKIWRVYEVMWTKLIEEGQASGSFRACGDPKMLAFGILGMCNWLARWYDPKKSISVEELIETYSQMCAFGLVAPAHEPEEQSSRRKARTLSRE